MIFIDNMPLENIAVLTKRSQDILSLLPGGMDWLRWAMKDTVTPACRISNENQLLELIQQGLHADGYIRLNSFRAHIEMILTLSDEDVAQLTIVRNTALDTEENLQNILSRNNLFSYKEINDTLLFISSENYIRNDLFQALSFSDMLALTSFFKQLEGMDDKLKTPAYVFAQKMATTIQEFIDLVFFSIYVCERLLPENLTPLNQNSEIQAYYNQFLPLINYLLFTPCLGLDHSESTMRNGLQKLAETSQFIGYVTGASAVRNLIQNIDIQNRDEKDLQTQTEKYLATIKSLVSSTPVTEERCSQDGKFTAYRIENDKALAVLGADEEGNIFLLPETRIKTTKTN